MREYAVDPLEALFVRDVMRTGVLSIEPTRPISGVRALLHDNEGHRRQRLYPIVDGSGQLVGVSGRREVDGYAGPDVDHALIGDVMVPATLAFDDETLRSAADRMATSNLGLLPVVERLHPTHLVGLLGQSDLFRARERLLVEERHRERIIRLRQLPRFGRPRVSAAQAGGQKPPDEIDET